MKGHSQDDSCLEHLERPSVPIGAGGQRGPEARSPCKREGIKERTKEPDVFNDCHIESTVKMKLLIEKLLEGEERFRKRFKEE